jgi:hypothetical protein
MGGVPVTSTPDPFSLLSWFYPVGEMGLLDLTIPKRGCGSNVAFHPTIKTVGFQTAFSLIFCLNTYSQEKGQETHRL